MSERIGVGLFGTNGHQIQRQLIDHPRARLAAIAEFDPQSLPEPLRDDASIRVCGSLDELLAIDEIGLVSLCSPRRREQADQAIRCLEAGRPVLAEKPCAMTEPDLDAILAAVERTGTPFREMANGIAESQPYLAMRQVVEADRLGRVVQIFAQKSYPYHDDRPQDEDIDGGLIGQNAGHALRMIEQVAGQRIEAISAIETTRGNPGSGGLHMACAINMRLAGGGVATAIANYLNPRAFGSWGNEALRVFGTDGMAEITDGGARSRLVTNDEDCGPLDTSEPGRDFLEMYLDELAGLAPMPRPLPEELSPTRWTIRAVQSARQTGTS